MRPTTGIELSDEQVEQFVEDGFIHLAQVVPADIVAQGMAVLWGDLTEDAADPGTWTRPVVRLLPSDSGPFKTAFESPRLHAAFDRLVGAGRWESRPHLGLFVVRFPHPDDPGDTGWHIDSSYPPDQAAIPDDRSDGFDFAEWRVNVASRGRGLLLLFLFSDVGPDDAPTAIRVGSHRDVAPLLRPAGPAGMQGSAASMLAAEASRDRPTTFAIGGAGDVYLCHPFLVHAAQAVRGPSPRFLAQPPLGITSPFSLDPDHRASSPVEMAIRRSLEGPG